ncbi:MAG: helix-turn-helix transcriptional regulator [Acidobacteria bacterium]|nr:helix-turn-helix transcriptional regulator [Acidobacteriota bacterium]
MTSMNKALGEIISRRRQGRNLSQEELADRAGIHRTYVSQIERGLKSPTLSILIKVAKALDTKASIILSELEREVDGVHS